ncbi:MAG: metallopeptidase TldD-related protein [Deltaproteobacteria bacterium]
MSTKRGNPSELAARCVEKALGRGASAADAVVLEHDSHSASVRLREVESVELCRERRVGVRCFHGQASAIASTADLSDDSLDSFVNDIIEMAKVLSPDPEAGLPQPGQLETAPPALVLADAEKFEPDGDAAIALARRCEEAALDADPRIRNSEGATFSESTNHIGYASSVGFQGEYHTTSYSLSVAPLAENDGAMQRDYWWDSSRRRNALATPEEIGRVAAERTLRRLGARKIPTTRAPVIFEAPVAGSLAGHLASAICGGALYRGMSFLRERLGDTIASPLLTIVDDGRLDDGPASRPFDAEGLPTRRSTIVDQGRLENFLLDTYAARKLGMASTGNASRSLSDAPGASPTNFHIAAGTTSPAAMLAGVSRGLLVTSLSGMGVNPNTGDYSRGASGLWIEDGAIAFAVEEITIAGNLLDMYLAIDAVGDDLRPRSGIASPSLRIGEMTIAGS